MIIKEELTASIDEPAECVVMHRAEPSKMQILSLQLASKLNTLADTNEQTLDPKSGQGYFYRQSNWFDKRQQQQSQGEKMISKVFIFLMKIIILFKDAKVVKEEIEGIVVTEVIAVTEVIVAIEVIEEIVVIEEIEGIEAIVVIEGIVAIEVIEEMVVIEGIVEMVVIEGIAEIEEMVVIESSGPKNKFRLLMLFSVLKHYCLCYLGLVSTIEIKFSPFFYQFCIAQSSSHRIEMMNHH